MKDKKRKIAIIGHFGGDKNFSDGQTVKTKNLYKALREELNCTPYKVDTYYKKHNPFKLLWQTFVCLFFYDDIFVLLSFGGMKIYFPLLYFVSKIRIINVYHDVIGGDLDNIIEIKPKFCKYMNSFTVNWVETKGIKSRVEKFGVYNVEVLPNFKYLDTIQVEDVSPYEPSDGIYEFCTFSRVMAEKGITDAINSICEINQGYGKIVAKLDIYGPVDATYQAELNELIKKHSDCIAYMGVADSRNSVQTLKQYFALLFPTRWNGEGFPGTILDCYASAVPVIASDWNSNGEIINHMETGLLYPNEAIQDLNDSIKWAIEHKAEFNCMKKKCREEYKKYTPDYCISIIYSKIRNGGK